ncbi:hypothetical protein TNCV_2293201 [Trichonephila clavipes]|nr:hypothetical protein TNCV_2293201 [Trichonephila clavipes]
MEQIYTYIKENDDCQFTMQELRNAITTKYIPDENTIRKWLIDRYHDDIVISCFCASYKEATLYEASATFATPSEIKPGSFAQIVHDNADFNINTMKCHDLHKSAEFTCRNCGGGDRGRVVIYRPIGEFRRAEIVLSPVWCSRPTTGVPLTHATMNFVGLDKTTSDSSKNAIDTDSDDENEMHKVAHVPTPSEMRNIIKGMSSCLDSHSSGETN